jgi:hypothetical protein
MLTSSVKEKNLLGKIGVSIKHQLTTKRTTKERFVKEINAKNVIYTKVSFILSFFFRAPYWALCAPYWALALLIGHFALLIGHSRSLLGTLRSLLGTLRSLLGTFALLIGHFCAPYRALFFCCKFNNFFL